MKFFKKIVKKLLAIKKRLNLLAPPTSFGIRDLSREWHCKKTFRKNGD